MEAFCSPPFCPANTFYKRSCTAFRDYTTFHAYNTETPQAGVSLVLEDTCHLSDSVPERRSVEESQDIVAVVNIAVFSDSPGN